MNTKLNRALSGAAAIVLVASAGLLPAPARAQSADMAGIGTSSTVTASATVLALDPPNRGITLQTPAGRKISLVAGPRVVNYGNIKVGDTVVVQYQESRVFVLSPRNGKIPDASLTGVGVGAAPGQLPAGGVAARLVVSGRVVSIDPASHTLDLVDPSGGEVRTMHVTTAAGLRNFSSIKVGDTITAVINRAVAVSVQPAT